MYSQCFDVICGSGVGYFIFGHFFQMKLLITPVHSWHVFVIIKKKNRASPVMLAPPPTPPSAIFVAPVSIRSKTPILPRKMNSFSQFVCDAVLLPLSVPALYRCANPRAPASICGWKNVRKILFRLLPSTRVFLISSSSRFRFFFFFFSQTEFLHRITEVRGK